MSASNDTNTNSAQPSGDKSAFEKILNEQQQVVKQQYKETTTFIKDYFLPHFNLYQKAMIQKKMQCFEDNPNNPSSYYGCIDKIDQAMQTNSLRLKQKFARIDEKDSECQDHCKTSFSGSDNYTACMQKCSDVLKKSSVEIYEEFYKTTIADNAEFKKIKK